MELLLILSLLLVCVTFLLLIVDHSMKISVLNLQFTQSVSAVIVELLELSKNLLEKKKKKIAKGGHASVKKWSILGQLLLLEVSTRLEQHANDVFKIK